jgi:hypothetical protein
MCFDLEIRGLRPLCRIPYSERRFAEQRLHFAAELAFFVAIAGRSHLNFGLSAQK